jgi:hypothetical protein
VLADEDVTPQEILQAFASQEHFLPNEIPAIAVMHPQSPKSPAEDPLTFVWAYRLSAATTSMPLCARRSIRAASRCVSFGGELEGAVLLPMGQSSRAECKQ